MLSFLSHIFTAIFSQLYILLQVSYSHFLILHSDILSAFSFICSCLLLALKQPELALLFALYLQTLFLVLSNIIQLFSHIFYPNVPQNTLIFFKQGRYVTLVFQPFFHWQAHNRYFLSPLYFIWAPNTLIFSLVLHEYPALFCIFQASTVQNNLWFLNPAQF